MIFYFLRVRDLESELQNMVDPATSSNPTLKFKASILMAILNKTGRAYTLVLFILHS